MGVYRLHFSDGTHQNVEAGGVTGAARWAVNLGHDIGEPSEPVKITDPRGVDHDGIDAIFAATKPFDV